MVNPFAANYPNGQIDPGLRESIEKMNSPENDLPLLHQRIKDLEAENAKLKKERFDLARLVADSPQFYNPLLVYEVKKLRDSILKGDK